MHLLNAYGKKFYVDGDHSHHGGLSFRLKLVVREAGSRMNH